MIVEDRLAALFADAIIGITEHTILIGTHQWPAAVPAGDIDVSRFGFLDFNGHFFFLIPLVIAGVYQIACQQPSADQYAI